MNNPGELKILIIFSFLASINLMVLFLILFFKRNNTLSNKVLGLLVLIPSLVLTLNTLLYLKNISSFIAFIFLGLSVPFFFGPLLLLYIYLVQGNTYQFKRKDLFHFFPISIVTLYGLYINFKSDEFIYENYLKIVSGEDLVTNLIYFAHFIHFTVYITWSIRKVNSLKTKTYMSIVDKVNYKWLKFFVTRLLYLNILLLLVYIIQMSFFSNYTMYIDLLATPLVSTCFYPIIVYKSFSYNINTNETFDTKGLKIKKLQLLPFNLVIAEENNKENIKDLQCISKLIQKEIKDNKFYLKSDYTIFDLSKQLKLPQRTISDIINKEIGKTFSDLINHYRVEESKLILVEKSKVLTIDAIAELSGFKSRATFYRVFKEKTNVTPVQYIKEFKVVS